MGPVGPLIYEFEFTKLLLKYKQIWTPSKTYYFTIVNLLKSRFTKFGKGGATKTEIDNLVGPKQSSNSIVLNKNGKTGWWNLSKSWIIADSLKT